MEKLIGWVNEVTGDKRIHPLLIISVFFVCFLAIHPFQDCNGRLAWIATTLLLLRFCYEYVPFASLESVIEENKDLYYKSPQQTQKSQRGTMTDWEKWSLFFLKSLKKQKDGLTTKLERENLLIRSWPPLSGEILKLVREHETLTIAEIETLTGANRNTLKVRLHELVRDNFLEQTGRARASRYRLKSG